MKDTIIMTAGEVKIIFEEHYDVSIAKDGMKEIYKHYSRFDENIIEEALECCFEQYEDAQEAFEKLGGVCYNKSVQYLED